MKLLLALVVVFVTAVHSPPARAESLKVLTFNTWLLELLNIKLAKDIASRRAGMVEALLHSDADVLNLIEVWQPKNADFLVDHLKSKFPFCSYAPDRVRFGAIYANGLLVLSKYPLKNDGSHFRNGCTRPLHSMVFAETTRLDEQFVSKGALHNVVVHPSLGAIDVYSSHLGALSFDEKTDDYVSEHKAKILKQAESLVSFIDRTSEAGMQVLAIDTNRHFREWSPSEGESTRLDPTYLLFLKHGLHDTFMEANGLDPMTLTGLYTFDIGQNPYAGDGHFKHAPSEFIDYVFVKGLRPWTSKLRFNQAPYLSDHYAIESTVEGEPTRQPALLPLAGL